MSRRQSRRPSFSRDVRAPQKHLSMPHPARILSRGGLLAGTSLLTLALAMPVAQARHRRARPRWPRAMTLSMFHVVGSGELSDDQKKMLVGKETAAAP
jgi:hypothetical protein